MLRGWGIVIISKKDSLFPLFHSFFTHALPLVSGIRSAHFGNTHGKHTPTTAGYFRLNAVGTQKTLCFYRPDAVGIQKTLCFYRPDAVGTQKTVYFSRPIRSRRGKNKKITVAHIWTARLQRGCSVAPSRGFSISCIIN